MKLRMLKIIVLILVLLPLTACEETMKHVNRIGVWDQIWAKPTPWGLGETPDGSPIFKQGWEDGCETGLGIYGATHYRKEALKFKQDISLINNPEYYRAWKDAYTYCRWYVWNWSRPFNE